jgi:hypothetical protein
LLFIPPQGEISTPDAVRSFQARQQPSLFLLPSKKEGGEPTNTDGSPEMSEGSPDGVTDVPEAEPA